MAKNIGGKAIHAIPTPTPTPGEIGYEVRCSPVTPSRYAEVLGIPPLFFWGVRRGNVAPERALFFSGEDRRKIWVALLRATGMVESQTLVKLCPGWEAGERHPFTGSNALRLNWKHFVEAGVRSASIYGAPNVVYTGDYGTVTIAHGGVGSADEVRVYYDDGLYSTGPEPSSVNFGSTYVVITFPRERLLEPDLMMTGVYERNHEYEPAAWETVANFVESLVVARVYNDPSTNATFRVRRNCNGRCTWTTQTGCVQPEDERLGWVNVRPATYSSGTWCRGCYRGLPEQVEVSYKSGLSTLPVGFEDVIVRLAHTLLPNAPCPSGGEPFNRFWSRDRIAESAVTKERVNCQWGPMDGAWYAWNFVQNSPYNYSRGGGWMGSTQRRGRMVTRCLW